MSFLIVTKQFAFERRTVEIDASLSRSAHTTFALMVRTRLNQLKDALSTRQFVRFSRRFEAGFIRGYILDVGPRFFLMALVSDRLWFDGFECFRFSDVIKMVPEPNTGFAESALQKRRERLPKKPRVSVASIEELLVTADRRRSEVE